MLSAANFYLTLAGKSKDIPEEDKINFAINSLGLDDINPFDPQQKIIEYVMKH